MIDPELLEILRCPLNPRQARLEQKEKCLVCRECNLRFPIKDGFPVLIAEEAELPNGCESLADLPCQKNNQGGEQPTS